MVVLSDVARIRSVQILLLGYAATVAAAAIWFAYNTDLAHPFVMGRGMLRVFGICVLAYYLNTQKKAAWWFGIAVAGVLSVLGVAGILIFGYYSWSYDARRLVTMAALIVPTITMIKAFISLSEPSTKLHFMKKGF